MAIGVDAMLEHLQEIAMETGRLKPEDMAETVRRRWQQEGFDPDAVEQMGNMVLQQMMALGLPPEECVKSAFATGMLMGAILKRKVILP